MLKIKNKKNKYEGIGFVELIIAIGIAGIALMVLMTMSANSMREAIRLERHDALTRLALDGALIVRRHAEKANDLTRRVEEDRVYFGSEGIEVDPNLEPCYEIDFDGEEVVFTEVPYEGDLHKYAELQTKIVYDEENKYGDIYYVAYCVDDVVVDPFIKTYIGKVVTGYVECKKCGEKKCKNLVGKNKKSM